MFFSLGYHRVPITHSCSFSFVLLFFFFSPQDKVGNSDLSDLKPAVPLVPALFLTQTILPYLCGF